MSTAESAWFLPGRVEILGKHTDYAGGRALVCAVDRGVTVRAERIPGRPGRLEATTDAFPGTLRFTEHRRPDLAPGHWGHYVRTAADRLHRNFGPLAPARIRITSDLPPASGMSSSSATLSAVALALADLSGLPSTSRWEQSLPDRVALAGYLASMENGRDFGALEGGRGMGTHGGSLDHLGMLTAEEGLVSAVGFDPTRVLDRVPLPAGHVLAIGVSGVLAEKSGAAMAAYNRGPALLGAVLDRWNARHDRQDATLQAVLRALLGTDLDRPLDLADRRLGPLRATAATAPERHRLEQFLVESGVLVPLAHRALAEGSLPDLRDIVRSSQRLARTHLRNQVPETNALVEIARSLGVIASSFGAGFGGSVWALVPAADAAAFCSAWMRRYRSLHHPPGPASTIIARPGPAGRRLALVPSSSPPQPLGASPGGAGQVAG